MATRRVVICDECNKEERAYAPKGYRKVSVAVRDFNGVELHNASADVCSDRCERAWQVKQARERSKEIR